MQCALERDVLVAVFPEEVLADGALADALFELVRKLAQVKTPLIPDVIDIRREVGTGYVILEDAHAVPLMSLLNGRVEPERLTRLGMKLAEGFAALAQEHLVYGGLRPSKLYLVDGNDPLLPDFSPMSFEAGWGTNPPERALVGSAPYVAPEQYMAPETVDTRADMFALGMTLYALGTGQVPFGSVPAEEILERKLRDQIPSPCDVVKGFPRPLAAVLGRLTRRAAAERYADWDEVACDLAAALRGEAPAEGDDAGAVIALPNPAKWGRAERTIRISAAELRAHRGKPFQRKRMGLWGWVMLAGAAVLALALVVMAAMVLF
ncbi:MAG: serine/threonine protein kinase [Candidatus Spyradenecus sp.]